MKIGIVTVHDSSNFGSFLQAYALNVVLTSMGHEVHFIKTRDDNYLKRAFYKKYPFSRRSLKHPIDEMIEYFEGKKKKKCFSRDIQLLNEVENVKDIEFDKILLGSDEIWNVTMNVFTREIFYGAGMENVSAFAVSAGKATFEQMKKYPELIADIEKLDSIYVRDDNTCSIVKEITKKEPDIVCDPTFLPKVSEFSRDYQDEYLEKNDYILIYSYPVYISETVKNNIIQFAKEHNLKIVSACFRYSWCDYYVNCSPLEFCAVLQKAKYVVTTTFHGTIFSILNHKNFACIPFSIKVSDVIQRLNLKGRILDSRASYTEFENLLQNQEIDYEEVETIIDQMRTNGLEKLKQCIEK